MNPLDLVASAPGSTLQNSLPCQELLFSDLDPTMSPPTSVPPGLDELDDFLSVQHAAEADDVDSSNVTTSVRDDGLSDGCLTDSFFNQGCFADGFIEGCFTESRFADDYNEGYLTNYSIVELSTESHHALMDCSLFSRDGIPSGADELFDDFICWDAANLTEPPSGCSDTSTLSTTDSLEQDRSCAESSPSWVGDSPGWGPLTTGLLSVDEVGCLMDEDDQLQLGESTPPPDTSKVDEDDDVIFLYERTCLSRKRLQKNRRHHPRLLGRSHSSDSSLYFAPISEALARSKNRFKAHKLSKRPERCRSPAPTARDPRRWMNEWFRLEKVGVYESGGRSVSEYTWMGQKRGWGKGRRAQDLADASQISYVVVRRSSEGYGIKASWNEESAMFLGEDGMNNKTVRLSKCEPPIRPTFWLEDHKMDLLIRMIRDQNMDSTGFGRGPVSVPSFHSVQPLKEQNSRCSSSSVRSGTAAIAFTCAEESRTGVRESG
ncbi:uncharacterized protein VDAG_04849 [Verticillium dahliae VdLs.17]|uniref:Uncharacterized protein n=1 Tax=Verticillium dahliae (strain VdLs.17 / ATCC MYA-4575 / FGSC 10137) TaxID=498257 RepID=G2X364_VERDV|nr:uncharacterized protein VDAG_04849 [Verticillium dahliae VdLs.17]EGY23411.1 hypothetical protein VDAG_04849 [Verticillium dahliae VdLs.17]